MNDAISLFRDVFVPNVERAPASFASWKRDNPGEYSKWVVFRDSIFAAQTPDDLPLAPTMASKFGKHLVAAGELAMQFFTVIHLAQQ